MSSSNKTEKYGLNQWAATDPVLMEDFNADNLKAEQAVISMGADRPYEIILRHVSSEGSGSIDLDVSSIDFTQYGKVEMFIEPIITQTLNPVQVNLLLNKESGALYNHTASPGMVSELDGSQQYLTCWVYAGSENNSTSHSISPWYNYTCGAEWHEFSQPKKNSYVSHDYTRVCYLSAANGYRQLYRAISMSNITWDNLNTLTFEMSNSAYQLLSGSKIVIAGIRRGI